EGGGAGGGGAYGCWPPPPQRCLVSDLTVEAVEQLQQQGAFDAVHLQRLVVGLSPVLARELVHRSQGEPQRCWELLQELRQHYEQGTLALSICTTPQGTRYLSALPLPHCPGPIASFASAQDAVAAFYGPYIDTTALPRLRHTAPT